MREAGAEIIPVDTGSATLVDAVSECMRYYVSNCDTTHLAVGSAIEECIFKNSSVIQSQISKELKSQLIEEFGEIQMKLVNVIGGGSSAIGFWSEFIDYPKTVELIGVEENIVLHLQQMLR